MSTKISMDLDETLELDYLVEEISRSTISYDNDPSNGSSSIQYGKKEFGIFDPSETGTYQLDIDGQKVTIEVTKIPDSAVYQFKLDEGSGSTITDSVQGYNSTYIDINSSVTWQSTSNSRGGYLIKNDGGSHSSGLGELPDFSGNMSDGFCVLATVYKNSTSSGQKWLADSSGSERVIFIEDQGDSTPRMYWNGNTYDFSTEFNTSTFYRFAINGFSDTVELYKNGSKVNDISTNLSSHDSGISDLGILKETGTGSYVNGYIDNVIFCNSELSPSEIDTDYNLQPWV